MKLVTDEGRYIRWAVIDRAGQLYAGRNMTWKQAMIDAYREAKVQRDAVEAAHA